MSILMGYRNLDFYCKSSDFAAYSGRLSGLLLKMDVKNVS
ncbi:hypothetical protein HMPREF9442_00758 [Paraprevotella xylaniphila YIT 11841]|uniref:Uncharacterized protein n=1 Tax=Paraprevotella xylaniphila YIT 11841 TaxID=762982 RepID=F3QRF6_9BACT|nr:hypothetical protein HMPREF9442_00758 [Paraprevotella xylaniphila YIT 11841]